MCAACCAQAKYAVHHKAGISREALHKKKRTIAILFAPILTMAYDVVAGCTRYELSQLIKLALPLVAAQLAQMGMGVVDTIMAGRVGALELSGVALGGAVCTASAPHDLQGQQLTPSPQCWLRQPHTRSVVAVPFTFTPPWALQVAHAVQVVPLPQ